MPTAETHVVRVISFVEGATELVSRTVPVARPPVPLSELQGNPQEDVVGWQVQSVNRFSASAFSDTLFSGAGR